MLYYVWRSSGWITMSKEKDNKIFSEELRRLRKRPGYNLTQTELGELVGVTASYISQLESGNRKPSVPVVRELSKHLGVSTNHLLGKFGMAEMDLANTFIKNKEKLKLRLPQMQEDQLDELANYLTYIDFKSSILE